MDLIRMKIWPLQKIKTALFIASLICLSPLLASPILVPLYFSVANPERFEDTGVTSILLIYNGISRAALATLAAAILWIFIRTIAQKREEPGHGLNRFFSKYSSLKRLIVFFGLFLPASIAIGIPLVTLYVSICAALFVMVSFFGKMFRINKMSWLFFIGYHLLLLLGALAIGTFAFFVAQKTDGVVIDGPCDVDWHGFKIDFWWIGAVIVAWWSAVLMAAGMVGRRIRNSRAVVSCAVETLALLIIVPFLSLAFLSLREIPISENAKLIFPVENLYDARIDRTAGRLLVSQTNPDECFPASYSYIFAFPLGDPTTHPEIFKVPAMEIEDYGWGKEGRVAFVANVNESLDRTGDRLTIYKLDGDTFEVKKSKTINAVCGGSINYGFIRDLSRLFIRCDNNNMIVVDTQSLEKIKTLFIGKMTMLTTDPVNDLVYLNYDWTESIDALDAKSLELSHSAPGPFYAEKMLLAPKKNRLFVPAPLYRQIMVFSTPGMELVARLPSQLGVRAMAFDPENNLLLAASYISGYLDVIDLATHKRIKRFFVSKFGRTLVLDPSTRTAFMTTTKNGLYEIKY